MMKSGAVAILTTMILGFLSWTAAAIINLKTDVARVDQKEINSKEMLIEMRSDIKLLLRRSR